MTESVKVALFFLLILIASTKAQAEFFFNRKVKTEIEHMFDQNYQNDGRKVTIEDVQDLPKPVQTWLQVAGVVGNERTEAVRLKQKGQISLKPGGKWFKAKATQYFTVHKPAFIWQAKVRFFPLIGIIGRDKYEKGQGHMLMKLLSLFKVVDEDGPAMDQGTLTRFLGEIVWFPSAALREYIVWEPVDDTHAKATMSYENVTASAVFEFDASSGAPVSFRCKRYYARPEGATLENYLVVLDNFQNLGGVKIPVTGEAIWELEEGDYSYYKVEITNIEYNKPELY